MDSDRQLRDLARDRAIENFKNGLNCGECVLEALIHVGALHLPPEATALATGFGGGLGLTGHTCGALSAAVLAAGAVHGRPDPWASPPEVRGVEVAEKYYRPFNRLVHDFATAHGAVLCRDICAPFEDWHSRERRKTCLKLIGATAALACDYLVLSREEAFALPYGPNLAGQE